MTYTATKLNVLNKKIYDWMNYKFRASTVGNIMTEPRSKTDTLSETTKSFLNEIYIEEIYNRKKDISNKYIDKGNINEETGILMLQKYLDIPYLSSRKEMLSNEYITGTPDIRHNNAIYDIKCSYDIFSFAKADGYNDIYYTQLQSYMWLTGYNKAYLVYCLTSTDEMTRADEEYRASYRFGGEDSTKFEQWKRNYKLLSTYEDLPDNERIKVFSYEYDPLFIEKLKEKIIASRNFLDSIEL